MENISHKKVLYKNKNPSQILGFRSQTSNINRVITHNGNSLSKLNKKVRYLNSSSRAPSPRNKLNLNTDKELRYSESFKNKRKLKLGSPYPIINTEFKKNVLSPEFPERNLQNSPNILNKDVKDKNDEKDKQIQQIKLKKEHETNVKMIFYFLTALIYYSLYLICTKILFNTPMPYIPPIGTSLFIICLNNLILSIFFIAIDQINYFKYIYFEIIIHNFLQIITNFISILLIIKSLENMNLLIFIILINTKPLILSYLNIRESNRSYKLMDSFCYLLSGFIWICEFFIENKISIISSFLLITIDIFSSLAKLKKVKHLHPYLIILGSSLIGFSISPIIMVIKKELLIISFTQYLLFFIISLTYFFDIYFVSKYTKYSFGKKFKIFISIFIYFLYLSFSILLLREDNNSNAYIFFLITFFINIYSFYRNDSINL